MVLRAGTLTSQEKRRSKRSRSLLIASEKSVVVAGGEEVRSGNLTFHYQSEANFEVITWTNHGLAYALVSSLVGSPQHSCLVCHQNMADQNLVEH